jgi:hypothetical protein
MAQDTKQILNIKRYIKNDVWDDFWKDIIDYEDLLEGHIVLEKNYINSPLKVMDIPKPTKVLRPGHYITFPDRIYYFKLLLDFCYKIDKKLSKKTVSYSYRLSKNSSNFLENNIDNWLHFSRRQEDEFKKNPDSIMVETDISAFFEHIVIAKLIHRIKILGEFQERLKKDYSETKGDNSWQNWISKNNWLFGVNYREPIEKAKINLSGIMPDFLYPTVDDFVDVLEIKLPKDEVLVEDTSHKGSWKWTTETNSAIGQVVNYLIEIDRLRFENENKVQNEIDQKVLFLKPRAFILIGDSKNWNNPKKEALRKLNYYLHNIEVLTYKDLLDRGNQFINKNV